MHKNTKMDQEKKITIEVLDKNHYMWFLNRNHDKLGDVYIATESRGWFPTELVAGVKERCFSEDTSLSRNTGWLNGNGCRGSMTAFFRADRIKEAIKVLKNNGYQVEFK